MDIELLKTFLEVNRTRHFGKAAANLFLTQAAVSARIRTLEAQTGVPLFTRQRNNIRLTAAGQKLLGHAESIIDTWNRARHEIAAGEEHRRSLSVGAVASLWDMMSGDWVSALYERIPQLLLLAEVGNTDELLRRARDGTLDLALMYESPQTEELHVEEFAKIQLVMVSTEAGTSAEQAITGNYVYVDWGTTFGVAHARAFPVPPTPSIRIDAARLARAILLKRGGSAYLASRTVVDDVAAGRLHLVKSAPSIERLAYAVYASRSARRDLIREAVTLLGNISRSQVL